jgi:hypothetical protein
MAIDAARGLISRARRDSALVCVSHDDLLAPYHERQRADHEALCAILTEHFAIPLTLGDFMTKPDADGVYFTRPLDIVQVTGSNRLIVVTCNYAAPRHGSVQLEIVPKSVEFHMVEAA